jgi:hypothetical protein
MSSIFTPATTMLTTEHMSGSHVVKYMASRGEWEERPISDQDISFSGQVIPNELCIMLPNSRTTKRTHFGGSSKLMDKLHAFFCDSNMDVNMCISFKCALSTFLMFNIYHTDPNRFHFTCRYRQPCCTYCMLDEEPIYILPIQDRLIKIYFAVSEKGPEVVIIGRMIS